MVVITQLEPIAVVFTLPQQSLPAVAGAWPGRRAAVVLALAQDATGGRAGCWIPGR